MSPEKMNNAIENREELENKEKANNLGKMIDQVMDLAMKCPPLEKKNPTSPFGKTFEMDGLQVKIEGMLDDAGRFAKIDITKDGKKILYIHTRHSNSSVSQYPNNLTIDLGGKALRYNGTLEKDSKTDKYRGFFDKGDAYENVYPSSQKYLEQIKQILSTKAALSSLHNDILKS